MSDYLALDWLKATYKDVEVSDLGEAVVIFLDKMWGIHNCNRTSLGKVDWSNNAWVEVVTNQSMSTIDDNNLTRLVAIAHQMMLRVELQGVGPRYIKLIFHQRTKRTGRLYERCPHIEDHIRKIIKYHPSIEEQNETD